MEEADGERSGMSRNSNTYVLLMSYLCALANLTPFCVIYNLHGRVDCVSVPWSGKRETSPIACSVASANPSRVHKHEVGRGCHIPLQAQR